MRTALFYLSSLLLSSANAYLTEHKLSEIRKRSLSANSDDIAYKEFDFVVIGGGLAGLVVAARLSEDPTVSVAVLEAGGSGDEVADQINIPALAYSDGLPGTPYDWQYRSVPQPSLDGRSLVWPRGKVLGGSSAINGEYLIRASSIEYDLWGNLSETDWNWENMAPYIAKSENFSPAPTGYGVKDNARSRGTKGPIHYAYPQYMYDCLRLWVPALAELGVGEVTDQGSGETWGAFITTSSINPANQTRSYARTGYLDPNVARPNLVVVTNTLAKSVVWDCDTIGTDSLKAIGVQYIASDGSEHIVYANKEVVVSGGVVNSPLILELSGIGNPGVLSNAQITTLYNLPGVGENLADHYLNEVSFLSNLDQTNSDLTNQNMIGQWMAEYRQSQTGLMTYVNNAIAYPSAAAILGSQANVNAHIADMQADITAVTSQISANLDPKVVAGLTSQWNALINGLYRTQVGQAEFLLTLHEPVDQQSGQRVVGVQAAMQHTLSRGSVHIQSADPTVAPILDPKYGQFPSDFAFQIASLRFARAIGGTTSLSSILTSERAPGTRTQSQADWMDFMTDGVATEYHPSGSCTMGPERLGGVVSGNLTVYGTSNLRVIDASVIPFPLCAHLMATVYGIAERGADMIKETWDIKSL